ncbi:MAG: hypothetical protein ACREO1_14135 [Arenimonas sp.]
MFKFRLIAMSLLLSLLAGCGYLHPSESAMQAAISDYVLQEKDYPREFISAENFVFSNLTKVANSEPAQYQVQAEFDFTYTADGDVIVAALDEKNKSEREQERRRTNNPLKELKGAVKGALETLRYENRFKNVRMGDQDHFSGSFTFTRNADNSWHVGAASYK